MEWLLAIYAHGCTKDSHHPQVLPSLPKRNRQTTMEAQAAEVCLNLEPRFVSLWLTRHSPRLRARGSDSTRRLPVCSWTDRETDSCLPHRNTFLPWDGLPPPIDSGNMQLSESIHASESRPEGSWRAHHRPQSYEYFAVAKVVRIVVP